MEENNHRQGNTHFPEDKDAPVKSKNTFLNDLNEKYERILVIVYFASLLLLTLFTVSFSIYIIAVKYL